MALKNKSMYAILGILNIQPSTGYDIKKYSDTILAGFWNENFGHIYPTLKTLTEEGLIEILPGENLKHRVYYSITKEGKKELQNWLVEETSQQPVRSEFMLKLLFSENRPKEEVVQMLKEYRSRHEEKVATYLQMQQNLDAGTTKIDSNREQFVRAVLRRGILSGQADIQWFDEVIREMN